MTTYLSNKLSFFSFWLIVLVVILHSLNIDILKCDDFFCFLQYFIAHKITQIAVPLFFAMTGYLYFLKMDLIVVSKTQFFIDNSKKRLRTIVLPFVLWCLIWFAFLFILQQLPFLNTLFSQPLYRMRLLDQFTNLFITPVNYPFWFLRDLILLFAFSPIIYISIKYLNSFALVLYLLLSYFYNNMFTINGANVFLYLPLFYFALGAFFLFIKLI
jgi:surface polysaccharide O-acyltransferase-like enzyme